MIKVSCCILSYRNTQYLPDTIRSVIEQDYSNIQVIICDDGSESFPESIEDILLNSGREYIIIRNKENIGTVKNVNNGCKVADGDIILTLAADDMLYKHDVISRIVEIQERTGDEMFACRRQLCDKETMKPISLVPSNKEIELINQLDNPEKQFIALATRNFYHMASGCCMVYTKKLLENSGYFDEEYLLVEDAPFLLKYLQKGNIIKTHYDVISIKYRDGGISNCTITKDSKIFKDGTLMYKKDILPFTGKLDIRIEKLIIGLFKYRMLDNTAEKLILVFKQPGILIWKLKLKILNWQITR